MLDSVDARCRFRLIVLSLVSSNMADSYFWEYLYQSVNFDKHLTEILPFEISYQIFINVSYYVTLPKSFRYFTLATEIFFLEMQRNFTLLRSLLTASMLT